MPRLTLRLPETLHRTLVDRATQEGVSMNQYLVYLLARTTSVDSTAEQRTLFERLRSRFDAEEAENALQSLLRERTS